jgi:long-chain fatty acid transport protein
VYYNPALLAMLPSAASAGFTAVFNEGTFTYDTTGAVVERELAVPIVPQVYASYRFGRNKRMAAGFGVWAPYGLGIEWPRDFEGRFISWKTQLQGIYLQPTVAYQLIPGALSVGGGVNVVFGGIEINQHVDAPVADDQLAALGIPLGTDIASAELGGTGVGVGGQVAFYWQLSDRIAVGGRYMLPVTVDLEGDADFEQLPTERILRVPGPTGETITVPLDNLVAPLFEPGEALADQAASASLEFPPQAVIGVRLAATPRLALSGDYQWTGWSTFDVLVAQFDGGAPDLELVLDYVDTHTFRTGASYALTPAFEGRAGFIYNTAASPDQSVTPILPEAERQLYTVGFGYQIGRLQADVYYNYVNQADRRGRVRTELPPSLVEEGIDQLNIGVYSTTAHLVGLTLSYVFGDAR